jgi:hypothetical protein
MTMRGWLHLLSDLRASFGDDALVHELPLGVIESNRKRSEANGSVVQECATLGGCRHTSTAPAVPTARTRRAE